MDLFSWHFFCSQPAPSRPRSRQPARSISARQSETTSRASSSRSRGERLRVLPLILLPLLLTQGCGTFKEIAAAAAERATARGIEAGKVALAELGEKANVAVRDLGADLYDVAKSGLQETGNIAAFKAGEVIEDNLRKHAGDGTADALQALALKGLQYTGAADSTGAIVKEQAAMSLFEQIMAGLGGVATTAVAGGAVSHSRKNGHDRRVTRKQFEEGLRNMVPTNGNGKITAEAA